MIKQLKALGGNNIREFISKTLIEDNVENWNDTQTKALTGKQSKNFCIALSKLPEDPLPVVNHFIRLSQKLLDMSKSVWGNTLDKSETWMFINKEPTDVCVWERHIRCVIAHLDEGYNTYQIPVSPLTHGLIHIRI